MCVDNFFLENYLQSNILFTFDKNCQEQKNQVKIVGEILRTQRENKGLLLRQIAALAEIDQAILSKIERSERKPSKELLLKLSGILGLEKEEMLIHFLSEKIAYEIAEEKSATEILKVAETKVRYIRKNGKNKNAKY